MLSPNYKALPHPDVVCTCIPNGETVLLHLGTSQYYSLNGTGTQIWNLITRGLSIGEISAELQAGYALDAERALKSVLSLTENLRAERLIVAAGPES
jgi:hypothetical protein